ncbi:MAG: hypothetical protein KAS53_09540 [Candidatus Cloacimonetes bacterium]|nr:hypothetical protein [Candidatus Cloacimonadota bacterium]
MKRSYKLLNGVLILLLFILISCSSDSTTGPENDTIDPTVSFGNIANGADVSGIFNVTVNASDNDEIDLVAIYLDGQKIGEIDVSRYSFTINCNDYEDGEHTLQAKAWDRAGNIGITNIITINTTFDFAPYSNGTIKVSITHYLQIDPVDIGSYGDPYFVYIIEINGNEFETFTSSIWQNTYEINTPIDYTFDIPDDTREYQLTVYVRDDDIVGYEELDYTPTSGYAYIWTLDPITSDFSEIFNGEDDGSSGYDDNDCEITLNVNTLD